MLKQHTSESSLNWHGLTWIGGTFESDTGGTFHSDMPGTFQSAADGTFVSAIDGTFQSDMSGTFGPMLSNKGTSMLLINTERGLKELPTDNKIKYVNASYEDAKKYNRACIVPVSPHPKRVLFFEKLQKTDNIVRLIDKTLSPRLIKKVLLNLKILINKLSNRRQKEDKLSIYITEPVINSICFRNKKHGWKNYLINIEIKEKE